MRVDLNNDGDSMTNFEIVKKAGKLELPNFRYFMRDELCKAICKREECGVVNLNRSKQPGSHHTCYWVSNNKKYYFDSFGVIPPKELVKYLKSPIMYSTYQIQQYNDTNCSEWCLYMLNELNKGKDFIDIIIEILNKHKLY